VSTKPHIAPSEIIRSTKGRLQHLIRAQSPKAFRRNYCIRSIGSATRTVVEDYVASQLGHHLLLDVQLRNRLAGFQRCDSGVDLSLPVFSAHGEYFYNLQMVFVNEERWMETRDEVLECLSEAIDATAMKHGLRLSRVALLPEHIHLTVGCPIDRAPESLALEFLNNFASVYGMKAVYQFGYYVGTIGEYDRGAVS